MRVYWQLSSFYFLYFASLGVFIPYWSPYLASLGFDPVSISQLLAIVMVTKVIAPYCGGWWVDHGYCRLKLIRCAGVLSAICFCGVYWRQDFVWLCAVMAMFSFFWHMLLPQYEAMAMDYVRTTRVVYSRIRLWGSSGFIVAVLMLGGLGLASHVGQSIPVLMAVLLVAIALLGGLLQKQEKVMAGVDVVSILPVLRSPGVIAFLSVCFLMQLSHGGYYTFFSIYLEDMGYNRIAIGGLWALGVFSEIVAFFYMGVLRARWGVCDILLASVVLTALRWVAIAWAGSSVFLLLVAQVLHAFSFGTFHAAAMMLVDSLFQGRLQGRGQALYASLSFGAGGALGALISGWVWVSWGSRETYLFSAAVATSAIFITVLAVSALRQFNGTEPL